MRPQTDRNLMAWAGRSGVLRGQPTLLGISYDDPDVTEICIPLEPTCA